MSDDADLLAALVSLPATEGYTPAERYHDFRQLFMGSDQGKRVLREILAWGHLLRPAVISRPVDPYLTHVREGESNMARRLLATVCREPSLPPPSQTQTPQTGGISHGD